MLLWLVFGAGLLVQILAPPVAIENNAFAIRSSVVPHGAELRVAEIVGMQRRMQGLSAVLTVTGALGLALHYRRRVWPKRAC